MNPNKLFIISVLMILLSGCSGSKRSVQSYNAIFFDKKGCMLLSAELVFPEILSEEFQMGECHFYSVMEDECDESRANQFLRSFIMDGFKQVESHSYKGKLWVAYVDGELRVRLGESIHADHGVSVAKHFFNDSLGYVWIYKTFEGGWTGGRVELVRKDNMNNLQ